MNLSLIHWLSAFLLLILAFNNSPKWSYSPKSEWVSRVQGHFLAKGNGSDASRFLATLATGDKSRLKKKFKRTFKLFGIYHLFTPSGLHLTAILLPFFYFLKKKRSKLLKTLLILILLSFFWLEKFYSLKRMCLFHILKLLFPKLKFRTIFILTFFLNFLWGGWSQSPVSFTLSYLFFGSIIFSNTKRQVLSHLFFSQMLVASFFEDYFSPFGFLIGQFFNLTFSLFFPVVTLATSLPLTCDLALVSAFLNLIQFCSKVLSNSPVLLMSPLSVLLMYLCWMGRGLRNIQIFVLLILPSSLF